MSYLFDNVERFPIMITEARGSRLYDKISKRWFLDFACDVNTYGLGYVGNINRLLREFYETNYPHNLPAIVTHELIERCAARVCETYGYEKIFFSNSGSEAVETALKIVRKYQYDKGNTKRKVVYTVRGNFHGRNYGSMGLTDCTKETGTPYHKEGFGIENNLVWDGYGLITEENFKREIQLDRAAAVFLAPINGNNVVRPYKEGFLQELRRYCSKTGMLLVFDEVQTGSGWVGDYSAAKLFGVHPDIMILGKRMAAGFPVGATLTSMEIAKCITKGSHFNTFAPSPFVCFFILKFLDWLRYTGLSKINLDGEYMERFIEKNINIKYINRFGMMFSFYPDIKGDRYNLWDIKEECFRRGLLLAIFRRKGEIKLSPPVSIEMIDLQHGLSVLEESIHFLEESTKC